MAKHVGPTLDVGGSDRLEQGDAVDVTKGAAEKADFFDASMHISHVTGFPRQQGVLGHLVEAPHGVRLDLWRTDPTDERHISGPSGEGAVFSTRRST